MTKIIFACSIFSLLTSCYLVYDHYQDRLAPKSCDFSNLFSCSDLLNSPYAYLFGVPLAHFGLLWSVFLSIFTARAMRSSSIVDSDAERRKKTDEPTMVRSHFDFRFTCSDNVLCYLRSVFKQHQIIEGETTYNYQMLFYWLLAGIVFVVYLVIQRLRQNSCLLTQNFRSLSGGR